MHTYALVSWKQNNVYEIKTNTKPSTADFIFIIFSSFSCFQFICLCVCDPKILSLPHIPILIL